MEKIRPMIRLDMAPRCCGPEKTAHKPPGTDQPFVTGTIDTAAGPIPRVSSSLQRRDRWGTVKARWGVGRLDYCVDPGLYALGAPNPDSPVLATANYKMTFDRLREALPGRDAWILVLDTKGINVWCAAGKGTFGTDELVERIASSCLKDIVKHRRIVLPQLAAPGVTAHMVKQRSGFRVYYGPIRSKDIPAYLDSGYKATDAMRMVTFPFRERAVLIPLELIATFKPFLILAPILFLLGGLGGPAGFWVKALHEGSFAVAALLSAIIGGAVLNPILLPYLPGRAFSVKGFFIGVITAIVLLGLRGIDIQAWPDRLEALAWMLIVPAVVSYLAVNFTGASTYTSLSGVKKELKWALPVEIAAGASGFFVWLASRWIN